MTMPTDFPVRRYFWIVAILAAIVMLAPLRLGDLPGYDDAHWSLMAKDLVQTHNWFDIRSNGAPALEHPPLFTWIQTAFFLAFGVSDSIARLPAALCGIGVILLVYWLVRRLTGDSFVALLAMFVMAGTIYFLKYSARAMTDVPFTLFTLCAVCAWVLAEEKPVWYLAVGLFTAMALMTREMMGFALPAIFFLDWLVTRRRLPAAYISAALVLAFVPVVLWYGHWILLYGDHFFDVHATFLSNEVYGQLSPSWRRYTGAPEYLWMVTKSYWPWLPFMIAGLVLVIRRRDRRLMILAVWIGVVFVLCSVTKSRVLRYMLPAYPAFAACAALGFSQLVGAKYLRTGLRIITPVLGVVVVWVALKPPVILHADEIRPIISTANAATANGEEVTFYDQGQPRIDEVNQMLWYGDRLVIFLFDREMLQASLRNPRTRIFIMDRDAYRDDVASKVPNRILTESGHLVCILVGGGAPQSAENVTKSADTRE